MRTVSLYTDGACSGNPGVGGYAGILRCDGNKKEYSGAVAETTNNQMELQAIISGLSFLTELCNVEVYSDSAYVVDAMNMGWVKDWVRNGWRKSDNKAVKNVELWQQLLTLCLVHEVTFNKVKGHSDNEYNNRCDMLAVAACKKLQGSI